MVRKILFEALQERPEDLHKCQNYVTQRKYRNLDHLLDELVFEAPFTALIIIDGLEDLETLRFAAEAAQRQEFELIPVWTVSYNAAEALARAADILAVDTVMMGVSRRSAVYHMLRGHVVNGLTRRLPQSCHLLLFN